MKTLRTYPGFALLALAASIPAVSAASRPEGIDSDFRCCTVDWPTVAADGIQFACIKATQWTTGTNPVFADRMQGAQAADIYTLPYHRCNPSADSPQAEAQYFWNCAGGSIAAGGYNLGPALDVEDGLTGSYLDDKGNAISLTGWCNEWFADVAKLALGTGVHFRQLTYVNAGTSCKLDSSIGGVSWIAWPDSNCGHAYGDGYEQTGSPWACSGTGCQNWGSGAWTLWQWVWATEGQGILPGLQEHVDQNVFNGTLAQMVATLGTTADPTDIGPIQPEQSGAMHLFGFGSNGDTYHDWQLAPGTSDPTNWSGMTDFGGGQTTGDIAVARNPDGRLEIFIVGKAGDVQHNWQVSPGGAWNGFVSLAGTGITGLRVANNRDGSLHVFGVDASGTIWQSSDPGGTWSGWSQIPGITFQPGFTVAMNATSQLILLGVETGPNHHVDNFWQTAPDGNAWGNPTDMGNLGGTNTNPSLRVARELDGRLALFGIGQNGHVWHNWEKSTSGGWNGFVDLGTKSIQPGFVVGLNADGRMVLNGVDAASPNHLFNVWEATASTPSTWGGWTDKSLPSGVTVNGQIVLGRTSDVRMQLFFAGSNGHLWSLWQSTGGWSAWSDFGNAGGVKLYPGQ